jgi:hypothetical protein
VKHFHRFYLIAGSAVCLWLSVAAFAGWKAPNLGVLDGGSGQGSGSYNSSGRGYGGFWGGGK